MCGCLKKLKKMFKRKKRSPPPPPIDLSGRPLPSSNIDNQQLVIVPPFARRAASPTTADNPSAATHASSSSLNRADDIAAVILVPDDRNEREKETNDEDRPSSDPADDIKEGRGEEDEVVKNDDYDPGDQREGNGEEEAFYTPPVKLSHLIGAIGHHHDGRMRALEAIGTAFADRLVEHGYNRLMLNAESDCDNFRTQRNTAVARFGRVHGYDRERQHDERDVECIDSRPQPSNSPSGQHDDSSFRRMKQDDIEVEDSFASPFTKDSLIQHTDASFGVGKLLSFKEPLASKADSLKVEKRPFETRTSAEDVAARPKEAPASKLPISVGNKGRRRNEDQKPSTLSTGAPTATPEKHTKIVVLDRSSEKNREHNYSQQHSNVAGKARVSPSSNLLKDSEPKTVLSSKVKKSPKPIVKTDVIKVGRATSKTGSKASPMPVPTAHGTGKGVGSRLPKPTKHLNLNVGEHRSGRTGEYGGKKRGGGKRQANERR